MGKCSQNTNYEVHGCQWIEIPGLGLQVFEVPDDEADFFGLYLYDKEGKLIWQDDLSSRDEAERIGDSLLQEQKNK